MNEYEIIDVVNVFCEKHNLPYDCQPMMQRESFYDVISEVLKVCDKRMSSVDPILALIEMDEDMEANRYHSKTNKDKE